MGKATERTIIFAAALLLATFVLDAVLARSTGLNLLSAIQPFTVSAILVCAVAWLRIKLARVADQEERDESLERRERVDTALFETDEGEPFSLRRTQRQVEQYLAPWFTPVLAVLQGVWAWRLWKGLPEAAVPEADWLLSLSFLVGQAFFLFLFSRFLIGVSRHPSRTLARGPGVLIGLVCIASVIGAVATLAGHLVHPMADRIAAYVLTGLLALLALENVLAVVIGIYSPRRAEVLGVAYHSRIGGLLSDPAGWVKSFTHAIDYQFGFKMSETWFYRVIRLTLIPMILGIGLAVYLMSCFVFIGPHEAAVLERFGKPVEGDAMLESGLHVKAPWPFATVRRAPAKRVLRVHVGHHPEEEAHHDEPEDDGHGHAAAPSAPDHSDEIILWTVPHYGAEDPLLVASRASEGGSGKDARGTPVAFVDVSVPVEYRVSDLRKYIYNHHDTDEVVEQLSRRVFIQTLAGQDLIQLLGAERLKLTDRVKEVLQKEADDLGLGVEFLFVGLQGIHPPTDVAEAFQSVVAALEEKEAVILAAEAHAISVVPLAEAEAQRTVWEAEAFRTNRVESASAEADHFEKRLLASAMSPQVFRLETYLTSLQKSLKNSRKYIVDSDASREVITFNFEEKLTPDSFDLLPVDEQGSNP